MAKSYKLIFVVMATVSLLIGCSTDEKPVQSSANVTENAQNEPEEAVTEEAPKKEADKPKEDVKLSAEEQLAIDALDKFINEPDQEKQRAFVEANFHADVIPIFTMIYSLVETVDELAEGTEAMAVEKESDTKKFENAAVVESKEYKKDGKEGTFVLLSGKIEGKPSEMIVFIMDAKIGWIYGTENEEQTAAFNEVRKEFN